MHSTPDSTSPTRILWLIPIALAAHNAEEAWMFPRFLPLVRERLSFLEPIVPSLQPHQLNVALLWATIIPLVVVLWATMRPASVAALWSALTIQAVVAINVVSHIAAAVFLMRGYSPGLATAVCINAPLSVYIFRRARIEHWLSERALTLTIPAALFIHGPGLVGLILASG